MTTFRVLKFLTLHVYLQLISLEYNHSHTYQFILWQKKVSNVLHTSINILCNKTIECISQVKLIRVILRNSINCLIKEDTAFFKFLLSSPEINTINNFQLYVEKALVSIKLELQTWVFLYKSHFLLINIYIHTFTMTYFNETRSPRLENRLIGKEKWILTRFSNVIFRFESMSKKQYCQPNFPTESRIGNENISVVVS